MLWAEKRVGDGSVLSGGGRIIFKEPLLEKAVGPLRPLFLPNLNCLFACSAAPFSPQHLTPVIFVQKL